MTQINATTDALPFLNTVVKVTKADGTIVGAGTLVGITPTQLIFQGAAVALTVLNSSGPVSMGPLYPSPPLPTGH